MPCQLPRTQYYSPKECKFKYEVNAFKYMCKYLTNTCNMSQNKCTESRALGNKSKHEISATFFAYIISMNVKEVIMGSILVG